MVSIHSEGNSMNTDCSFSWRREADQKNNLEFIVLNYRDCSAAALNLEAWITPSVGSNLCRLAVNRTAIIDFDPELLRPDFTGTPVLYPTPNRVRGGVFRYQGANYPQILRGVEILEHGLVHGEVWSYQEPVISAESIALKTWIDFEPFSPLFTAFPFKHRLSLEFGLFKTGIKVTYTVENRDEQSIPFGFGLHPYFMRLGGDEATWVEIPTNFVMDTSSDLLPTGRLIAVDGTQFDLNRPVPIGSVDLDHVFTGVRDGKSAQVSYPEQGLRVQLLATADFSHLVLYSPRGVNFFCLENQTCSTDAHNLYDRGFKPESGLKIVPPGACHSGSVTYKIFLED
jgi:aldose 1-epimerase